MGFYRKKNIKTVKKPTPMISDLCYDFRAVEFYHHPGYRDKPIQSVIWNGTESTITSWAIPVTLDDDEVGYEDFEDFSNGDSDSEDGSTDDDENGSDNLDQGILRFKIFLFQISIEVH